MQCQKSLKLCWHSPLSSPYRHPNSHWALNNCTKIAYSLHWQPVYHFYVLSFESKIFETSQFLSHHHTHHLHDEWRKSTTFQRFQPAIYSVQIHAQVLDIYSPTSSPVLIKLILLDFHDVPYTLLNFSTMCRSSQRRVMQLDAWIKPAWRLSFIEVQVAHWPVL